MDLRQQIAEHDATMTSFLADLSELLESFVVTMCKIDVGRAPESLVTISSVFRKSRGGQGLEGCHFTQGGTHTVVIGETSRRNFSSAPSNHIFPEKTLAIGGRRTNAKGAFGAQGGPWPSAPLPTPLVTYDICDV